MDAISLVMFAFIFMLGFVLFLLGFFELKTAFQRHDSTSSGLGFIYFLIAMALWFILSAYWAATATDPALATLSWLWFGFAWVSLVLALTCIAIILKASVNKVDNRGLEITERED